LTWPKKEKKCQEGLEVSIILCDDSYLLSLNRQFLHKETLTDIITFDYSENKSLRGDIFISIDRIVENAEKYTQTTADELMRIMAHGMLHLCGYTDKTRKEKTQMTAKEDFYLNLLRNIKEDGEYKKKSLSK